MNVDNNMYKKCREELLEVMTEYVKENVRMSSQEQKH